MLAVAHTDILIQCYYIIVTLQDTSILLQEDSPRQVTFSGLCAASKCNVYSLTANYGRQFSGASDLHRTNSRRVDSRR